MRLLLTLLIIATVYSLDAQITQTIKGQIIDTDSELPLIGASIEILDTAESLGTSTDIDGYFRIENVPVGRYTIQCSYIGYKTITLPNIIVNAGKETNLDLSLEEDINSLNEVVITAETSKSRAINELATVSAKTFSLEEVTRYSGGRNDVSRLVSNFAGVSTADDSRNDIVIRGNSPTGVLWRLEGVPIPNPNHFSTLGTTGGPVSALNTNLLKNSDFMTSAFPAEYGNALSGVFDVGFRSGNRDKYEFTAQISAFSGIEAMAEGPIKGTNGGSFLVSYRHAFTSVAGNLGLDIGTNAIPNYRDLSFKIDLGQSAAGRFQLFGIAASSDIDFLAGEVDGEDLFAEPDTDALPRSQFGVVGIKHNKILSSRSYIKTVVSGSLARNTFTEFRYTDTTLTAGNDYTSVEDDINRVAITSYYNLKSSPRLTTRAGITVELQGLQSLVRDREGNPDLDNDGLPDWVTLRDVDDNIMLWQPFIHTKYKISDRMTANAGLHGQYLNLNNTYMIEPRLAFDYKVSDRANATLGYGLHSILQPLPTFFFQVVDRNTGAVTTPNTNLDFTKAHHIVAGYEVRPSDQWRVKSEIYYQHIYDVPVDEFESTFSMLNAGADFEFPSVGKLVNNGTGRNYGVELTIEKFFSQGYYGLLTTSLFQSRYTGSDGIERNSAFNNELVLNILVGKEWRINDRLSLTADTRLSTADGRYYTPVDLAASRLTGLEVLDNSRAFSLQQDPYFRWDVKLGVRTNSKRGFSQLFALDFQNVTNRENIFANRYNRVTNQVNRVNQSGFFPDILYRIQF